MKVITILAVILYIVSPIDLAPEAIDDFIVLLLGITAIMRMSSEEHTKEVEKNEENIYHGIGTITRALCVR